ncbi:MAG: hypothetical protein A2V70_01210 [Planctomycetes bacterium RBG_13_63_9]|nr:MAG: hypothetical protein A2V70_01210 [Planctomycetes bacterium RBG_13_63_9]
MDQFPLADAAKYSYSDDWSDTHHGTDIFASRGQPVLAVSDGTVRATTDPKGGNVVYLTTPDGWVYYYAHLDAWAPEVEQGTAPMHVYAGAFLGQVGTTGNAQGTSPHLHFQAKNPAGETVDPYALLTAVDTHGSNGEPVAAPPETKRRSRSAALALLGSGLLVAIAGVVVIARKVK